jgi:ankyrin repeat protein
VTPLMAAAGVGWHYRFDRRGRNLSIEVINAEIEQEHRSLEAVTLALDLGSALNAVNKSGETAAHGAANKKLRRVYDLLVARGARLDLKSKAGKTAKDLLEGVTGQ